MAIAFATYTTPQANTVLIPAEPGMIIRVLKIVFTAWGSMKMKLISDPLGERVNLTPPLHAGPGSELILRLGRGLALTTGRGKALGITTEHEVMTKSHSVVVWYELVN